MFIENEPKTKQKRANSMKDAHTELNKKRKDDAESKPMFCGSCNKLIDNSSIVSGPRRDEHSGFGNTVFLIFKLFLNQYFAILFPDHSQKCFHQSDSRSSIWNLSNRIYISNSLPGRGIRPGRLGRISTSMTPVGGL